MVSVSGVRAYGTEEDANLSFVEGIWRCADLEATALNTSENDRYLRNA